MKCRAIFFLVILNFSLLLLFSCDSVIIGEGKVVDLSSNQPIGEVKVNVSNLDSLFTNAEGEFQHSKIFHGVLSFQPQALLSKANYKPKVIFLESGQPNLVKLESIPDHTNFEYAYTAESVHYVYLLNRYFVSFLVVSTLIFIISRRNIKYRFLWVLGILWINFSIYISIVDGEVLKIAYSYPFENILHRSTHPFTIKIYIPFLLLLFWILYFLNRKLK